MARPVPYTSVVDDWHSWRRTHLNCLKHILYLTSVERGDNFFSIRRFKMLLRTTSAISNSLKYLEIVYKICINSLSVDVLSPKLLACRNLSLLVNIALKNVMDKECRNADIACIFLSKVTSFEEGVVTVSEGRHILLLLEMLENFVTAFTTVGYNPKCSLDHLGMVFCNLSQLTRIRNIFMETENHILLKLIPFMNHENYTRRTGIVGLIRNCVIYSSTSIHSMLFTEEINILQYLILPLAVPEQFVDTSNNDKLQNLPDMKLYEPDAEIRKKLLETLNRLCATTFGRHCLRNHGAYTFLRELPKWEKDPHVLLAHGNVVDILNRTEGEIYC